MHCLRPVVALLLIGMGLSTVEGTCVFDPLQETCRCSVNDLNSIVSIVSCVQATFFEFQGENFEELITLTSYENLRNLAQFLRLPLKRVVFANTILSEDFLVAFLKASYYIKMQQLVLENCTLVDSVRWEDPELTAPQVFSLQFKNVSFSQLFRRASDIPSLSNWMEKIQELTVVRSQLTQFPCNISKHFRSLTYLDLSENPLRDHGIVQSFCNGHYPALEVLRLQSSLMFPGEICTALIPLARLKHLDVSQNNFSLFGFPHTNCMRLHSLRILNLSSTELSSVNNSFPPNLEILDLSWNRLCTLDTSLSNLKNLVVSNNALHSMPSSESFPMLQDLFVDGNKIIHIHKHKLQSFKHLRTLKASFNPYLCSCSSVMEMKDLANSNYEIVGWPIGYVCDSPAKYNGTPISEVHLSAFHCNQPLIVGLICILVLVLCIVGILIWFKTRCFLKPTAQDLHEELDNVQYRT